MDILVQFSSHLCSCLGVIVREQREPRSLKSCVDYDDCVRLDHDVVPVTQLDWLAVARDHLLKRGIGALDLLECVGESGGETCSVELHERTAHVHYHLRLTGHAKQWSSSKTDNEVATFKFKLGGNFASLLNFDF